MNWRIFTFLALATLSSLSRAVAPAADQPYLYILGVAQDAGYPQAGCYAPHCMAGWEQPALRRSATALALVDQAAHKKYLFEATPDFPRQLYQLEQEAPGPAYQLAGIFLTHAHIGHYSGLMFLGHEAMAAKGIPVYAMPAMTRFLRTNGPWSQLVDYGNIRLQPLQHQQPEKLGRVTITPFLVPHRDEYSETVGYRVEGPQKSAIFIPDINKWSAWDVDLVSLVESVDYALVDATFYADGELPGRDMSVIQHPFVVETMKALSALPIGQRNKVWFIHLNHTNPLLNPASEQSKYLRAQGYKVAEEGLRLGL
jgi:pyrroloquinoline quinone biosynthesis protein B